ncbi:hypothetical protein ACX3O0_00700 [Homoserinimonas sp. A447]
MGEIDEAQESPKPASDTEVVTQSSERSLAGWTSAAAAFVAVGATSTIVQVITALALGTAQYFDWRWSTGGLVSVAAAIFMWSKGTSWATWRHRIWPWLIVVGFMAAGFMFVQSHSVAADRDLPSSPSFGFASHWTKVDSEATFEFVWEPTGKVDVDYSGIKACYIDQPWHECIDAVVSEYQFACVRSDLSTDLPIHLQRDYQLLNVCEATLRDIQNMQKQGGAGFVVATPGHEKLQVTDETRRIQVVKEPARTHVAVCYLGFMGECH